MEPWHVRAMGKGVQEDIVRTLKGALAAAVESTTSAERERDKLQAELATEQARVKTLQGLLQTEVAALRLRLSCGALSLRTVALS